jgi:FixJ family two-component response regulator
MQDLQPIIFVVDDDASIREGLTNLLESARLRVRSFASAQEFCRYRRAATPGCLVLDVRMPGLSGLELQRELVATDQLLPIIFITAYGDIPMAVGAMKAGATEFLPKPFRDQDLLDSVQRALESDRVGTLQREEVEAFRKRYRRLSPREREVMACVVLGKLNKQIGAKLGISEITVKVHRRHVMEKMAAPTLAELVLMVHRLG